MEETPAASSLVARVRVALTRATQYAWDIFRPDNHWYGELLSNATMTAEHVFLYQSLGVSPIPDAAAYRRYLLHDQRDDGSWALAPDGRGHLSASCEAYLALRILGVDASDDAMVRARDFIRTAGGVARVRIFTRIYFAMFGLFPWATVPALPAEFIFAPAWFPMNIYRLSSWARSTIIPLLLISHHRAIYALPDAEGRVNADSAFLDELWLDPTNKAVPYGPSGWGLLRDVNKTPAGTGAASTPSQTAWALMGLLAAGVDTADVSIVRAVEYLLRTQTDAPREGSASWPERLYTGVGFPNHFYLGYTLYRHYFPMMALGRSMYHEQHTRTRNTRHTSAPASDGLSSRDLRAQVVNDRRHADPRSCTDRCKSCIVHACATVSTMLRHRDCACVARAVSVERAFTHMPGLSLATRCSPDTPGPCIASMPALRGHALSVRRCCGSGRLGSLRRAKLLSTPFKSVVQKLTRWQSSRGSRSCLSSDVRTAHISSKS